MQPERRQHRNPFTADGPTLRAGNGLPVGTFVTTQIAQFAAVSMSFFDRFSAALKVCKAERSSEGRELSPAQQDLDRLLVEYERALRGTN